MQLLFLSYTFLDDLVSYGIGMSLNVLKVQRRTIGEEVVADILQEQALFLQTGQILYACVDNNKTGRLHSIAEHIAQVTG